MAVILSFQKKDIYIGLSQEEFLFTFLSLLSIWVLHSARLSEKLCLPLLPLILSPVCTVTVLASTGFPLFSEAVLDALTVLFAEVAYPATLHSSGQHGLNVCFQAVILLLSCANHFFFDASTTQLCYHLPPVASGSDQSPGHVFHSSNTWPPGSLPPLLPLQALWVAWASWPCVHPTHGNHGLVWLWPSPWLSNSTKVPVATVSFLSHFLSVPPFYIFIPILTMWNLPSLNDSVSLCLAPMCFLLYSLFFLFSSNSKSYYFNHTHANTQIL